MKEILEKKKKSQFKKNQKTEKVRLEEDFSSEMENFTKLWDDRMMNY